ncbi:MAG: LuxR family transcriptional regulator [Pseudomonadota bacterium]
MSPTGQNTVMVRQFEIEDRIESAQTGYDIFRLLRELSSSYDFDFFSIIELSQTRAGSLSSASIMTNWPPDLIHAYDRENLFETSPVIKRIRATSQPVYWEAEPCPANGAPEPLSDEAHLFLQFNIKRGVHFPTHAPDGTRGVVSFTGSRSPLDRDELGALALHATQIFEHLHMAITPEKKVPASLTEREREALELTAIGKTSNEIAAILNLSEHTVNRYLTQVCHKLSAQNRAHAVGVGLRLGIIE